MPMQRCEMRAAVTTWLRRVRAFRALGLWTCVTHLGSGAIRWLESDLRRKRPAKQQRGEHRPVASGRFFRRRPLSPCSFVQTFLQTLVRRLRVQTLVQTFVRLYKRWYRDRFQLPRSMAPALTNDRARSWQGKSFQSRRGRTPCSDLSRRHRHRHGPPHGRAGRRAEGSDDENGHRARRRTELVRPMCDGFGVQVVYTDLPNDRFQLVMMLSKAGRRRRFAAAPSRCGGLLAGVFSAPIHGRLGIPADVPALKFALQVRKAFVIRPFPGATRSTHLRWQVQPPLCRCTP